MKLSRTQESFLMGFLIVSSLVLAGLIVGDGLPQLRGPAPETSEWYWPYLLRPLERWWPAVVAALGLWLVSSWWLWPEKVGRWQNGTALTSLVIASFGLQVAVIHADQADVSAALVERTLSNLASGFFEPAAEIGDMNYALRNYAALMPTFASEHAQTHPPGYIVANWATVQGLARVPVAAEAMARFIRPLRCTDLWLLDRPPEVAAALGIWALLPLLAAALTFLPAFWLSQELLVGRAQRLAVVLAASLPALLLFAPKTVQLYAPLALLLFWFYHTGLRQRSPGRLLVAGLLLSVLTFLSLGNAALVLLVAVYAGLWMWVPAEMLAQTRLQPQSWAGIAKQALAFGLGAASLWLLLWVMWGTAPWEIASVGLGQHYELVTTLRRYDWWVVWNLIDLLVFSGWPLFLGFLGSLWLAWRLAHEGKATAVELLSVGLLILIVVIDLSGSTRGEVGRIWLFFMPLLAFPAARFWSEALPGRGPAVAVAGLQCLLLLALGLSWRIVRPVIVVAEAPLLATAQPEISFEAQFLDEPIALEGATIAPKAAAAGDQLAVTLFWKADGAAQRPYTVFTHLLGPGGELAAQQDGWPVAGTWPPTCWREGDVIVDEYLLTVPPDAQAGNYRLLTGLYDARDGSRLRLGSGADAIELGNITVGKGTAVGEE